MNEAKPLVSVVIPSYNRAQTVCKAIDSVLAQTYKPLEIIVVDDGSTDNTRQVLSSYSDKIKYFYKVNGGCSAARNYGIDKSTGEYIAFLDSDDYWFPEKIEKQMECFFRNKEYGMVICDMKFYDEDKKQDVITNLREVIKHDGEILEFLMEMPLITGSFLVMHRKVFKEVGGFDEKLKTATDFDMMLRICSKFGAGLVEEPLLGYKRGDDSISQRVCSGNRMKALEKLEKYNPDFAVNYKALLAKTKAVIQLEYAEDLLWNRYIIMSRKELAKSLRFKFTARAVFLYLKSFILQAASAVIPKYRDKGIK